MYKYLTRRILLALAVSSMVSPLLKADSYSDGVLSIDRVLVGSDIYHEVKVTVKDLIENNGGLAEANFDTYDGETGLLTIPRVEVGNDVYSNLVISLGQAISYESVSAVTTLPTTLADFTADIEHNNCHGLVDPDLTNTNFGVTHPIGSNEWSCDVVTDKTKHPIKSGEKSFRFELRPDECSRNNGFDDCINDRSRTELTSSVPKGANFDQSLLIVEYDIFIPSQTKYEIQRMIDGSIPTIYDAPWPGFTPDLLSIILVTAIQASGTVLIHQKMFDSRLFFIDRLKDMGAQIILCDPHRATVIGINREYKLRATSMSSPDIRAGVALLIAALSAEGTSTISNIHQIDRGYQYIDTRLNAIGANIVRED